MNRLLKVFQVLRIEAELGHVELQIGLVQQTHDDFFAEQGGQDGNANIQLAARAHLELDAAVLGEAALSNVKPAMTLRRETKAFLSRKGGLMISWSTPSMRKRTRKIFS